MRTVTFRIGMWAVAGLLIAMGWGFYFATANKATPIGSIVYVMVRLTQPVVATVVYFNPDVPLGLRFALVANAATYALVGIIVETVRKQSIGPIAVVPRQ
jgi:hypothetical protein